MDSLIIKTKIKANIKLLLYIKPRWKGTQKDFAEFLTWAVGGNKWPVSLVGDNPRVIIG